MFKIIRATTAQWNGRIKTLARSMTKMHDDMHVAAVSTLCHAAVTGDKRPLQAFFVALGSVNVNFQTSLRDWMGRLFKQHPEALCIEFKEGEFNVLPKTEKERKALAVLCEKALINPDGKAYQRFYERSILKGVQLFGVEQLAAALKLIVTKTTQDTDNRKSEIPADLRKKIEGDVGRLVAACEQHMAA